MTLKRRFLFLLLALTIAAVGLVNLSEPAWTVPFDCQFCGEDCSGTPCWCSWMGAIRSCRTCHACPA
jgi:hypothetical protein